MGGPTEPIDYVAFSGTVPNINSYARGQMLWASDGETWSSSMFWWLCIFHICKHPGAQHLTILTYKRRIFIIDFKIVMGSVSMEYLVPPCIFPCVIMYHWFLWKMPYVGWTISSSFLGKPESIIYRFSFWWFSREFGRSDGYPPVFLTRWGSKMVAKLTQILWSMFGLMVSETNSLLNGYKPDNLQFI